MSIETSELQVAEVISQAIFISAFYNSLYRETLNSPWSQIAESWMREKPLYWSGTLTSIE